MKTSTRIILFSAVAVIATGGTLGALKAGFNPAQAITQSRCEAGAFIKHDNKAAGVESDTDPAVASSLQNAGPSQLPKAELLGTNQIEDPGLENYQPKVAPNPAGWETNTFGDNDAKFSLVAGYNSSVAARVEMTKYTNGDGDWFYQGVMVKPGQYYTYADWYRSNVATRTVLELISNHGIKTYINLDTAPASEQWRQYGTAFFIPQDTRQIRVSHTLSAKGWLETDNASLVLSEALGFNQGLVSVSFDDGWKSIATNALPVLKKYDIVSTQYLISGYVGQAKDYMTVADAYAFKAQGSEIASHTVSHANLTTTSPAETANQLTQSSTDLGKCFGSVTDLAYPYGAYSQTSLQTTKQNYTIARSTEAGYNTRDNLDAYRLKVQNVDSSTTPAQIADWLKTARDNKVWLILVYHQVGGDDSAFTRRTADFERDMQAVKTSGLGVKTIRDAYAEVAPQANPSR